MSAEKKAFETWTKKIQGNFDHIQGAFRVIVRRFNQLSDKVSGVKEDLETHTHALDQLEDTDIGTAIGDVPTWDGDYWVPAAPAAPGATDHGALTGLGDDDHPQYLTEAEADMLYDPLGGGGGGGIDFDVDPQDGGWLQVRATDVNSGGSGLSVHIASETPGSGGGATVVLDATDDDGQSRLALSPTDANLGATGTVYIYGGGDRNSISLGDGSTDGDTYFEMDAGNGVDAGVGLFSDLVNKALVLYPEGFSGHRVWVVDITGAPVWAVNMDGFAFQSLTDPPVSTTVYPNMFGVPVMCSVQYTLNPTAFAAADVLVELSPDNSTWTTWADPSAPVGVAFDGTQGAVQFNLPIGWYYRVTSTNATIDAINGVG
jgi:hypothetical protein